MAHPDKIAKSSWMLTLTLASIAVVVAALYLAKGVLVPMTLTVLLSFLLSPVCDRLERYQRLLAGDQEEAAELFEDYLEDQPFVEVYDTVLIPALALAETHWQLGELNEGKHKFIMESLKELIQDRRERQREIQAKEDTAEPQAADGESSRVDTINSSRPSILCLPARSEADEIASMMLAQVLEGAGCRVQAVSVTSLADEMVKLVNQYTADVVCLSATPPAAVMHARYLCRRLRDRLSDVRLVVGLWDSQVDLKKARERIGCGAIVVATLAEAREQIGLLLPPQLPHSERPAQPEDDPTVLAAAT